MTLLFHLIMRTPSPVTSAIFVPRWTRVLAVMIAAVILISGCASLNVRMERSRRAHLNGRLYAEVRGSGGTPVVLVPGLMGSTRFWGDSVDPLAQDHRLILVDLLGFGQSPWPEDIDYSLDDQIEALHATLVAENAIDQVTIVGHSLGSVVAAHYAARYPDEVHRVVLLGVPVFNGASDGEARLRRISRTAALFTLNRTLGRWSCAMMDAVRPLARWLAPVLRPDVPREVAEDATMHFWKSIDGAVQRILLTHPVAVPLSAIGTRTVVLHGDRDTVTPLGRLDGLAEITGLRAIRTSSTHNSYPQDAAAVLRSAIRGAGPALADGRIDSYRKRVSPGKEPR